MPNPRNFFYYYKGHGGCLPATVPDWNFHHVMWQQYFRLAVKKIFLSFPWCRRSPLCPRPLEVLGAASRPLLDAVGAADGRLCVAAVAESPEGKRMSVYTIYILRVPLTNF